MYVQWGTDGAFVVSQIEVKCKLQESCSAVIGRIFVQLLVVLARRIVALFRMESFCYLDVEK